MSGTTASQPLRPSSGLFSVGPWIKGPVSGKSAHYLVQVAGTIEPQSHIPAGPGVIHQSRAGATPRTDPPLPSVCARIWRHKQNSANHSQLVFVVACSENVVKYFRGLLPVIFLAVLALPSTRLANCHSPALCSPNYLPTCTCNTSLN